MKSCTVLYSDGREITTEINGTDEEIHNYFKIGKMFNLGNSDDDIQTVAKCTINK